MIRFDGRDCIASLLDRSGDLRKTLHDLGIASEPADRELNDAIISAELEPRRARAHIAAAIPLEHHQIEDDWAAYDLNELVQHLHDHHHIFTRECLGRLSALIDVLLAEDCTPGQIQVRNAFVTFRHLVLDHLDDEERELFPQCIQLENEPHIWLRSNATNMRILTGHLSTHHEEIGRKLDRLQRLNRRNPWPLTCLDYYHAFAGGLDQLGTDLELHSFIEYEYLLPGAVHAARLERSRAESHISTRVERKNRDISHI